MSTPAFAYNDQFPLESCRRHDLISRMQQSKCGIQPYDGPLPDFKPLTSKALDMIWPIITRENGRTTDFSYGGLLMWVDYFNYSYAVVDKTLFIKGVVEDNLNVVAFALPVGDMPLERSLGVIQAYCRANKMDMELSAVPEYALEKIKKLNPLAVQELTDWGDYLYDAQMLATLKGKAMMKKRNHVNRFLRTYPEWNLEPLSAGNADKALAFMDVFDLEGDDTTMAVVERDLSRKLIRELAADDRHLRGAILNVCENGRWRVAGYTIGDVKGDTLFVHVEKATRSVDGAYEMLNREFAALMLSENPQIRYINREDDSGDPGLRAAKQSYHPLTILRKFNIVF